MGNAAAVAQAQVEYDADHIKSVVKDHVDTFEGEKIAKKDLAAKIAAHDGNDLDEDKALQILNAHYGEEEEVEKEKVQNWIVPVIVPNDTEESAPAAEGEEAAPAPAEGEEAAAPAEGEAAAPAEGEAAAPVEGEAAAPAEGEAAAPAEGEAAAPAEGEAAAPAEGEAAAAEGETASVQG